MPSIHVRAACSCPDCDWEFKSSFEVKNGATRKDVQRIANAARKYTDIHADNHKHKTGHDKFLNELDTQEVRNAFFELSMRCVCHHYECGWNVMRTSKTIQDEHIEPDVMGELIADLKRQCLPHIENHIKESEHDPRDMRLNISTNVMRDLDA